MAIITNFLAASVAAASIVSAVPLEIAELMKRTTVIDYESVVGFPQTVPATTEGTLYTAYQPYLYVDNGCVPFPAVDAAGDVSGGQAITGITGETGCTSSTGQVYARAASYGGYYAIMYSWFMPKDEPEIFIGHRYDWEGVVVWLKSSTATTAANIVALCPSAHGGWDCSTSFTLSGTHPLVEYLSIFPLDHSMELTTTVGGFQPLIAYESLPAAALTTLETYDFGDAIVPFVDATFDTNLANATP